MADKLLVGISANGATVARWRGRLVNCQEFANDGAGQAAFKEYLAKSRELGAHLNQECRILKSTSFSPL